MKTLYELRISLFRGVQLTEIVIEKETPKQYKVSGSKMYRSIVNKSEIGRVLDGTLKSEYHIWFEDLSELPRFKKELIEQLNKDLNDLMEQASSLEDQIEQLNKLGE